MDLKHRIGAFLQSLDDLLKLNFSIIFYSGIFAFLCSVVAYLLYFKILENTGAGNLLV